MRYKKLIIIAFFIIIIGFLLEIGLDYLMKNSLPDFIKEKNDTPYNFSYSHIDYSLFRRRIIIKKAVIFPKNDNTKNDNKGIYNIKIDRISIHSVHFIKFLLTKDLEANQIKIITPDIIIHQNIDSINTKKEINKYNLGKYIQINELLIKSGKLTFFNANKEEEGKKYFSIDNINLHLFGVIWDMINQEKRIPISYKKAFFSVENVFFHLNDIHNLFVKKLSFDQNLLQIDSLSVKSSVDENSFYNHKYKEKSLLDISVPTTKIDTLRWGYDKEGVLYAKVNQFQINKADIKIIGKQDNNKKEDKTAYIQRILPFNLQINSFKILQSKLNLNHTYLSKNINIGIDNINNKVNDQITIDNIKITDTPLNIYKKENKEKSGNTFTYYFDDILRIKQFSIEKSAVYIFSADQKILEMDNIYYHLNNVLINTLISNIKKEIPFSYSSQGLSTDSIKYYGLGDYLIKGDHMKLENNLLKIEKAYLKPINSIEKLKREKKFKNIFDLSINTINIPNFDYGFNQQNNFFIKANELIIDKVSAIIYENTLIKSNIKSKRKISFKEKGEVDLEVLIKKLQLNHLSIKRLDINTKQEITSIDEGNLMIKDLSLNNDKTKIKTTSNFPFSFSDLSFQVKNFHHVFAYHTLELKNISYYDKLFKFNNLELKPLSHKKSLMKKNGIDAYTLNIKEVSAFPLLIKSIDNQLEIQSKEINLDQLRMNVHQYDIASSHKKYKSLFANKLRQLGFFLEIEGINLKNSYISYEEESLDKGTGRVFFADINSRITNLNTGYNVKNSRIIVDFNSKFMSSGDLYVNWQFDVKNTQDAFIVKGNLQNFEAERVNTFLKPYLHASINGRINRVEFNYEGNNDIANGTFGMKFKDLQVTLYKKDGNTEKKLLSNIANLLVKKESKNKLTTVKIKKLERKKDKSFFSYLWKITLKGLEKSLL